VLFAPDTEWSLKAAVELVNTAVAPDTLTSLDELEQWWLGHRYSGRHDRTAAELEALRGIRAPLRTLLTAERERAAQLTNEMLSRANAVPQLVRHDELDWHIHAISPDAPLPERVIVESAMAMVDLIRSDELSRLSTCADAACDGLVLDLSRNRSRRFCSTRCANRSAAAAYRARGRT
jgi:predicted RNA-binding Zn ribbon-like protein